MSNKIFFEKKILFFEIFVNSLSQSNDNRVLCKYDFDCLIVKLKFSVF